MIVNQANLKLSVNDHPNYHFGRGNNFQIITRYSHDEFDFINLLSLDNLTLL